MSATMRTRKTREKTLNLLSIAACVATASAAADKFDFKDPKGVNAIYFVLDSELEPIMGMATGISGTVNPGPPLPNDAVGTFLFSSWS